MKVAFYTFGCTVNSAETQKMQDLFTEQGDEVTEDEESDAVIINSCAITGSAEKNVLNLIARLKKKNPNRIIAVVGCYGEFLKKEGKTAASGVDILLGNEKSGICDAVHNYFYRNSKAQVSGCMPGSPAFLSRKSGYIQVQNGCDNHCTYCIVPVLRGGSRSMPPQQIKEEVQSLAAHGCREVVLSGLNLGLYQKDNYDLVDILHMINDMDGIERIRLSSLEPMDVQSRFLTQFREIDKLVSHFHISLQSGCDRTLKQMNRNYSFQEYKSMIEQIRETAPGIAITTDIIVGFPGESENDFAESMRNVVSCEFSDIHIFKYSQRKGTPAALMPNQVTEHKKTSRATMLKGIKWQAKYHFYHSFVGETINASLIKPSGDSIWEGISDHDVPVLMQALAEPVPSKVRVHITGVDEEQEKLMGSIVV